jgi:hypothetical protein
MVYNPAHWELRRKVEAAKKRGGEPCLVVDDLEPLD